MDRVIFWQLFRYVSVGGIAFTVEFCSFMLIISLIGSHQDYNIVAAQTASFTLGLIISFVGSRYVTFKQEEYAHDQKKQVVSFIILGCANLILTNILMYIVTQILSIDELVAKVVIMIAVVCWNFIIMKKLIFR